MTKMTYDSPHHFPFYKNLLIYINQDITNYYYDRAAFAVSTKAVQSRQRLNSEAQATQWARRAVMEMGTMGRCRAQQGNGCSVGQINYYTHFK